jgi:hypothetical protein
VCQPEPTTGTVHLDGRAYRYTLHHDRLAEDAMRRDTAPGSWGFECEFQYGGSWTAVLSYQRRDEIWRCVLDGIRQPSLFGDGA